MSHPEKWRETCDPFDLPYSRFRPLEILGYPHAGNDVFHVLGLYRGAEVRAYIKAARQKGSAIENEVALLKRLDAPLFPKVIDWGLEGTPFSVTLELPGERLSTLLGDNADMASMAYLPRYGRALAALHRMAIPASPVADRRFFHAPDAATLRRMDLGFLQGYFADCPRPTVECFCHGDFHYANLLWRDGEITGILDFELAGLGNRDFDIAWALLLRPGQRFLMTEAEQAAFLDGYAALGDFDLSAVRRCMAQCYVYFLQFSGNDRAYCDYVRGWLEALV